MSPTAIVAYLALFAGLGFLFLFANLVVGWFVRPNSPTPEKLEVYECGEPTIGSSFVQFDLRFYVVALLFIIFDVEVAFFFPWAVVFGKSTQLMDPHYDPIVQTTGAPGLDPGAQRLLKAMGVPKPAVPDASKDAAANRQSIRELARSLARASLIDIAVFFAVLLVGFAYVWKRGDLDWVRAVSLERAASPRVAIAIQEEPAYESVAP